MRDKCILREQLEDFASQKAHYLVEEKKINAGWVSEDFQLSEIVLVFALKSRIKFRYTSTGIRVINEQIFLDFELPDKTCPKKALLFSAQFFLFQNVMFCVCFIRKTIFPGSSCHFISLSSTIYRVTENV